MWKEYKEKGERERKARQSSLDPYRKLDPADLERRITLLENTVAQLKRTEDRRRYRVDI